MTGVDDQTAQNFLLRVAWVSAAICAGHVALHQLLRVVSTTYANVQATIEADAKKNRKNGKGSATAVALNSTMPLVGGSAHVLTIQDIIVVPVALFVCCCYTLVLPKLSTNLQTRWWEPTSAFHWGACLHCSFSIYEMIVYASTGKVWLFYLHHILVIAVYGGGVAYGQFNYYLAWAGLVEMTNIPLSGISILGRFNMKGNPIYVSSGVILYITYVGSRIISMPLALFGLIRDIWEYPEETWNKSNLPHLCISIFSCVVIFGMSAFWFQRIHDGLMKHISGKTAPTKGSDMDKLSLNNNGSTNGASEKLMKHE